MNWMLCIVIALFSGCRQKPQETHYTEVIINAPQAGTQAGAGVQSPPMPGAPAPDISNMFSWAVPQGWQQEPGSGMRLATFHQTASPEAIDCYITALAGQAGGLEANLGRWLGQLGFKPTDENVHALISSARDLKTKDGLAVRVFDFTALQTRGSPSDKSMLAAMLPAGEITVFVKMTGSMQALKQNKDNFLRLLGSIVRKRV